MKKYFLILLLINIGCNGQQINKVKHFKPDISILNISLLDTTNITSVFGDSLMLSLEGKIIKKTSFLNQEQNEVIEIVFYPGSYLNEFSKFRVFKPKNDVNKPKVDIQSFDTESGVKLGIDKKTLISLKGKPTSVKPFRSSEIYEYIIDNYDTSPFLKKYNMPLYRAKYYFENSKLVQFEFGFDYP